MPERIDWVHRGDYIAKHGVTAAQADEAFADPDRFILNPDPASKSGRSWRAIGFSVSAQAVLAVIVIDSAGVTYGLNAWKASARDQRLYRERSNR